MNSPTKILIKQKTTFRNLPPMLLLVMVSATAFASTTWYVDGLHGNDSNNCKSPSTACKTVHHAITLAHSGDSIMVAAATYKESLTIGISLNVLGAGAGTTIIDSGGGGTVVTIPNTSTSVILSRMTIRNGRAVGGGGVYNSGTLTINNSTISGNVATGQCFFLRQFGLWVCAGGVGGGIYSVGTLTINNSTLSGNVAPPPPPCPRSPCFRKYSAGGGIDNHGTLTISNSTISGNGAWGPGGGINGPATLQNSIVANSFNGGNCSGAMTSHGYNLSSDSTCNFGNSGDRNNIIDPKLGALGNHGGPTPTIPLLSGSPAIDAGNPSGCRDSNGNLLTTDQRGQPRPDKGDKLRCDIGAYETQSD